MLPAIYSAAWRSTPAAMAWHLTRNSRQPWMWPEHLDVLSRAIVTAAATPNQNLMVMMPPRHGKSETTSYWAPTWFLETRPTGRVVLCSYEADFAAHWGRRVRNAFTEYAGELTTQIAEDSSAANRWHTHAGGSMVTAGVGGPITGKGADLLILDDPIKNSEQANSATYRDKVWDWWGSTFLTRREPGASVVLVLTRWHDDDIAGRLLEQGAEDWTIVRFPAIANGPDTLGRKKGDALWPARYDAGTLATFRRQVGDYVWSALYQQVPPNLEGGAVYYNFDPTEGANVRSDLTLSDVLPLQFAADFNINPGCHALAGQFDESTGVATAVKEFHRNALNAEAMATWLVEWINETGGFRWPELEVFGDASGAARFASDGKSSWDKFRDVLDRTGWPVRYRLESRNPGVADRVDRVNNALLNTDGERRYLIHPSCARLIADFRRMKWDGNELNKKDRTLSHASDADGYRIHRLLPITQLFCNDASPVITV